MLSSVSYSADCSNESVNRLAVIGNSVKRKLPLLANSSSLGERLLQAFGTDDKDKIAKILGFASKQSVYKVISGERELDFERLTIFRNYTKHSIDWLLTGEEAPEPKRDEDVLIQRVRDIVREELRAATVVAEAEEIGGEVGPIEPAVQILAPVVARIEPGPPSVDEREGIRRSLVSEEAIEEIAKRVKPRKRRTG
jgi:hypothetical protein